MTWRSGRCRALDTSRFDILMAGRMCIYSNKSPFLGRKEWENSASMAHDFIFFFPYAFSSIVIIILSAAETILNQLAETSFLRLILGLAVVFVSKSPKDILYVPEIIRLIAMKLNLVVLVISSSDMVLSASSL